ncbi:hypothetical protein AB0M80_36860 [Amycolatopsis sp. NPDC051045]|uniref:hypothetical protein n=1 Tax=Amycolatopsis sp. NPDC051045 TaxID=3156922 RepID=UPI0034443A13
MLLRHTRWAEQQFDPVAGTYPARDFTFAVVLGNAVLLTRDGYDATIAGVERPTLGAHTLATIRRFAASNRLAGGTEWGRKLFFDTTFQSYFLLAARLLWTELDDATRRNVERITTGQAACTTALGTGDDPDSGGWTPHGLRGGYLGDTKLEEMGVYAQSLAPALAWAPADAQAQDWRAAFGAWSRNEAGLPARWSPTASTSTAGTSSRWPSAPRSSATATPPTPKRGWPPGSSPTRPTRPPTGSRSSPANRSTNRRPAPNSPSATCCTSGAPRTAARWSP